MDILFVASELAPSVKVGGLADVVAALAKALRLLGHTVTVALPRYPQIEESGILVARRLTPIVMGDGSERTEVTLFDGRLASGVGLLLVDGPGLFDRPGVYGDAGTDYPDNARRFGSFCRAVTEVVAQRAAAGAAFDVVHAHDWPAAPVPYLMRQRGGLSSTRTVLTIHNLAHQGSFPPSALSDLGLSAEHLRPEQLEAYGQVSFLKSGIVVADAITTVSATYAREIQTPERGERLDSLLRSKSDRLTGIVNGIDYAVWNPSIDPALTARYDAEEVSNKGRCKSALLSELGLRIDTERPLIASLGRLVPQKGSDILAAAMPRLLKNDVTVVVAGSGDPAIGERLGAAAAAAPDRATVLGAVSEAAAHRILAAADLVLVPSRFEPCGLVQLYAQRYGAVPIVARTGGLIDTVVDLDASLETGTGFVFDGPSVEGLLGAVQRALCAMASPRWATVRRRVMRLDLGWDRPARRYAQLYRALA